MIVSKTTTGHILYGKVKKWKPGSYSDTDILTILTLTLENQRNVKVLCWNSEYGKGLSDQARKLKPGDMVSMRVEFDIGDPDKCTALELKTSGIYSVTEVERGAVEILLGRIRSLKKTPKGICAMVPSYQVIEKTYQTIWNIVLFQKDSSEYKDVLRKLRKGKTCFMYIDEAAVSPEPSIRYLTCTHLITA